MMFRATWPISREGMDMTRAELCAEISPAEMADLQFYAGAEVTGPLTWRIDIDHMQLVAEAPARPWRDERERLPGLSEAVRRRQERRYRVRVMATQEGLTDAQIAVVLGVAERTVLRDRQAAGIPTAHPEKARRRQEVAA